MESINVLIIEDTASKSDELKNVLIKNNYNVVGIATTLSEALAQFYTKPVDIVIIDVFLNGKPDGITFAETLTTTPDALKPFVFLTFSKDRQIFERAKLTQPFSFLMKPFNELEVLYAIEMAVEKFYYEPSNPIIDQNLPVKDDFLFVKKKNSLKKIFLKEIVYVEVEERYCNIITDEDKFIIQISLTKILKILENFQFTRTHRNYIINTEKINEIVLSDNLVLLKGNHKIVLSDKYKDFINQFHILK